MNHVAYIALGSNLKDPVAQIDQALDLIEQHPNLQLIQSSSKFLNPPIGITDQPNFVNAVCKIQTDLEPLALLQSILAIEQKMGRVRTVKNGPRVIDLDVVLYDAVSMQHPELELPHPRMLERSFVVWPLLKLNPDLVLPDGTQLKNLVSEQPKDLVELEREYVC